jgi:hypothetical protein
MANEKIHTNTTNIDPTAQPTDGEQFVLDTQEAREERTDRAQYVRGPGPRPLPTWATPSRAQRAFNNVRGYHDGLPKPEERGDGGLASEADPVVNTAGMTAARAALEQAVKED